MVLTDGAGESPTIASEGLPDSQRNRLESQYSALSPGASIGGRYEIVSVLGMGGMGVVYRARDLKLDRDVALKVIRPEMAQVPDVMERFRREILLSSKVTHKNVLRIHDLGEGDGISYISMDYVEGETLRDVLSRDEPMPVERAVELTIELCNALQAAHDAGVVHRDLKPGNILLDRSGRPYVADFGLSRSLDTGETMTQAGMILGTVDYMSPEQARGETPDHRGDLYSLGIMLYEMITGKLPFRTDNPLTSMIRRVHQDAPRVKQARTPPWLSRIVQRALQRSPDARYQSASEMAADLEKQRASMAWRRYTRPAVLLRLSAVLLALALVAAVLVLGVRRLGAPEAEGEAALVAPKASLALLPFRNATGDPALDWTRDGLPDLLRTDLMQGRALRLSGGGRVRGVLDGLKVGEDGAYREEDLRRIAALLDADSVLTGTLLRAGEKFRIEAGLQRKVGDRVASGEPIRVEGTGAESIFAMVDELSARIRDQLGVKRGWGEEDLGVTTLSTDSVEALRRYEEGLSLARTGNHLEAADRLRAALESDPGFGIARAQLAETYLQLGHAEKAAAAADRAAGDLAEASPYEAARIRAARARVGADLDAAEEAYRALIELVPADAEAHLRLALVLEQKGELERSRDALRRVLALDGKHPDARYWLGRVEVRMGNLTGALNELQTALGLHREAGNDQGRATVLNALGYAYDDLGQYDEAMRYYRDALEIRRRIGDRSGEGATLNNMAVVLAAQGRYDEAVDHELRALEIGREIGDLAGMARWHSTLGDIYQDLGRPEDALAAYQESLRIIRELGGEEGLAWTLSNVGYMNSVLGNYLESFFFHKEALEKSREAGDSVEVLHALIDIGFVEQIQGRYDEARGYLVEALALAREVGFQEGIAVALTNLANIQEDQGEYGSALASLTEAEKIAREAGDPSLQATCLAYLGSVRTRIGDLEGAGEALEQALGLAMEMEYAALTAEIRIYRGLLRLARGERDAAAEAAVLALEEATRGRNHRLQLAARAVHARAGVSLEELEEVEAEASSSGLTPLLGPIRLATARLHLEAGRGDEALREVRDALAASEPLGQTDLLFQVRDLAGRALESRGAAELALQRYAEALDALEEMESNLKQEARAAFLRRDATAGFVSRAGEAFQAAGRSAELRRLEALGTS